MRKRVYSFIVLLIGLFHQVEGQQSFYKHSLATLDGRTINMAELKGRKVVVNVIANDYLNINHLGFIDSLQKSQPDVFFIVIPASDLRRSDDKLNLDAARRKVYSFRITAPLRVKKDSGELQGKIAKWLGNVADNGHFDNEIKWDCQYFFISSTGILYAILQSNPPVTLLKELIEQNENTIQKY